MGYLVTKPFEIFLDSDGTPLENGYLYFGTANQNPETNPISIYWDADLTIPAENPVRTINGYAARSGTTANLYTASNYSITVKDSNGRLVYNSPLQQVLDSSFSQQVNDIATLRTINPSSNRVIYLKYHTTAGDGGRGNFRAVTGASPGTYTDNGGTIIVPTGGDGSAAWLRDYDGAVNVRYFGAQGDYNGTAGTDDTSAIQNAIDFLTDGEGGDILIPAGIYKITSTLSVGDEIVTGYEFITTRASEFTSTLFDANDIPANITANASKSHINIIFEAGATLAAAWSPVADSPVVAYNLYQNSAQGHGTIINPTIVLSSMIVAGQYSPNAISAPQTNNLIGIFAVRGCKIIKNTFIAGLEHGVVSCIGYWSHIEDLYVIWAGGRCLDVANGNAMKVDNVAFWYSTNGLVFDGDASEVRGIHTEGCSKEMTIFRADTCVFGPGYLEDGELSDGTGTNAITLGYTSGATYITSCSFDGLRVASTRPNKGGIRIWDASSCSFNECRTYSESVTIDSTSTVVYKDCDFTPTTPSAKVMAITGGTTRWASHAPTGTSYVVQGPWMFNVSFTPGSIAAGATYSYDKALPAAFSACSNASIVPTYNGGGNNSLTLTTRWLYTPSQIARVYLFNPTAAPIDPGTVSMSLLVFGSFP